MSISFKEDHISQIPALLMLEKFGYTYLTPDEALALRGGTYKPIGASALLRRNLFIYGLGGIVAPFIGIKLIDMLISVFF